MTAEDFLSKTQAAAREAKPVDRKHGIAGFVFAAGLLIALRFNDTKSMSGWTFLGCFAGFFALLALGGIFHNRYTKRLHRKHGLCCPRCDFTLNGKAALTALAQGTCEQCSERVIDPPAASLEPMEKDPFVPALLNRRELHAKLKQENANASFHSGWIFFPVIGISSILNSRWLDHRLSSLGYLTGMALLMAVFILFGLFWKRKRQERFARLGLCCPRCREPLLEDAALTALGTCRCARCHAGIFEPGPE